MLLGPLAQATEEPTVNLERTAEGLLLSAHEPLELGPSLEEVLNKAVPLHFTYQIDVFQSRWYWTDKRIATVTRTLRLAFQPLTRRWRVSLANGAGPLGLQYALHLSFDSLPAALASVGRLARWKIVDAQVLDPTERYRVVFRFQLDTSLLPRPLQIGVAAQPEWRIEDQRTLEVAPLSDAEPKP